MSFDDNLCQWVFKPDPVSAFKSDPSWMEQSPQASSLFGGSSPAGFACAALLFSAPFALCEAVGCISGLNDFAVMCDAIQKCGGHLAPLRFDAGPHQHCSLTKTVLGKL
jgi:hypothetical protein